MELTKYKPPFLHVMLTTRCTMCCPHCCFDCEPGKGEDMDPNTAFTAIQTAEAAGLTVSLGGGEPTLHPDFEVLFCYAMAISMKNGRRIYMVTNGSQTERMKSIFPLVKAEMADVIVSYDVYHDVSQVDPEVVQMYHSIGRLGGDVMKDTIPHPLIKAGRQKEGDDSHCHAPEMFVAVDGTVSFCACPDAPKIGRIGHGEKPAMRLAADVLRGYGGGCGARCWKSIREEDKWLVRQQLQNCQAEQAQKEYAS
jgi:hypothetical protein